MWSSGVYDFGLTDEAFWSLTPAQFHALGKRRDDERKQWDYGFGLICATIVNTSPNKKKTKKAVKPEDFMPKRGVKARTKHSQPDMRRFWEQVIVPDNNALAKHAEKKRHG